MTRESTEKRNLPLVQTVERRPTNIVTRRPRIFCTVIAATAAFAAGTAVRMAVGLGSSADCLRDVAVAAIAAGIAGGACAPVFRKSFRSPGNATSAVFGGVLVVALAHVIMASLLPFTSAPSLSEFDIQKMIEGMWNVFLLTVGFGGVITFPTGMVFGYFLYLLQTPTIRTSKILGCGSHLLVEERSSE